MKLYLIRHTKVAVRPGICYGQTDVPLADSFQSEKQTIAARIQHISFENVYCSPLLRCKVLAEDLFEKTPIIFDERLKELNFGDWEMKSWDDIYSDPKGKEWMENYKTSPTSNGESYPEMMKRISEFFSELKKKKQGNIAIVTHAGVIRILKSIIDNVSIDELFRTFQPQYGSVSEFEI